MTAMYHWIFVPLTLGLGVIMAIMETLYVRTGKPEWKKATKFWMKLFGINFAFGIATGLVLEFQFGTNWSNYSWFVGDIFGAPLAIEATLAFFLEATFISIMFFGWNKVSRRAHLTATWLTVFGATISALWILVANAWMQYPVGMEFNPETVRNEMANFWSVLLSPVALNKFFHTVLSGWVVGAVFVTGISAWFLLRKRNMDFALKSLRIGTWFGLVSSVLLLATGHISAYNAAHYQPMKLAAMEAHYEGYNGVDLIGIGILNPDKKSYDDDVQPVVGRIAFPRMLSFLGFADFNAFVPGIRDIIEGGYTRPDGEIALSFNEMQARGRLAIQALKDYKTAVDAGDETAAALYHETLRENFAWFGYGYLQQPADLIPNVPLTFYSFRLMVILGLYFILLFAVMTLVIHRRTVESNRWLLWVALWTIPFGYLAGQFGWVVAEVGRQPWAIQNVLPVQAAISAIPIESVKLTFFILLTLFTILLIAELRIMLRSIRKGPETEPATPSDLPPDLPTGSSAGSASAAHGEPFGNSSDTEYEIIDIEIDKTNEL